MALISQEQWNKDQKQVYCMQTEEVVIPIQGVGVKCSGEASFNIKGTVTALDKLKHYFYRC